MTEEERCVGAVITRKWDAEGGGARGALRRTQGGAQAEQDRPRRPLGVHKAGEGSHFGAGRVTCIKGTPSCWPERAPGKRVDCLPICKAARGPVCCLGNECARVLIGKMTRRSTSKTVSHWSDSPECEASTTLRLAPAAAAADGNGVQTRSWGAAHSLRRAGWRGRSAWLTLASLERISGMFPCGTCGAVSVRRCSAGHSPGQHRPRPPGSGIPENGMNGQLGITILTIDTVSL